MGPMKKASEAFDAMKSAATSSEEKLTSALESGKDMLKSQTTINVVLAIGVIVAIGIAVVAISRSSK